MLLTLFVSWSRLAQSAVRCRLRRHLQSYLSNIAACPFGTYSVTVRELLSVVSLARCSSGVAATPFPRTHIRGAFVLLKPQIQWASTGSFVLEWRACDIRPRRNERGFTQVAFLTQQRVQAGKALCPGYTMAHSFILTRRMLIVKLC